MSPDEVRACYRLYAAYYTSCGISPYRRMLASLIREFQEAAFKDYGATWNDVVLFSKPAAPPQELLTANNQVPYMMTFLNLRQGPVVVEIPPVGAKALLFGSFLDNWQAPIVDVGPEGEDEGRGGKYLFLPPAYSEPIPDGYLVVRVKGYIVAGGFRPVPTKGGKGVKWLCGTGRFTTRVGFAN